MTAQTDLEGRSHRKEDLSLKCKGILMPQGVQKGVPTLQREYCLSIGKKACVRGIPQTIAKTPLEP